jgi:hypothetical protein
MRFLGDMGVSLCVDLCLRVAGYDDYEKLPARMFTTSVRGVRASRKCSLFLLFAPGAALGRRWRLLPAPGWPISNTEVRGRDDLAPLGMRPEQGVEYSAG